MPLAMVSMCINTGRASGMWTEFSLIFVPLFSGPGLGQVLREELDTLKAKRQELRKEISATWRVGGVASDTFWQL